MYSVRLILTEMHFKTIQMIEYLIDGTSQQIYYAINFKEI